MFLSQDGKRLLLIYQKQERSERSARITELYAPATLQLLTSEKTGLPQNWYELDRLSEKSFFGVDLTTI